MMDVKTKLGLDYNEAQALLNKYISEGTTRLHLLESEAIMRALARHFNEDEDEWGIIGLLHDIDWGETKNDISQHCIRCIDILKKAGGTDYLVETIVSHAYGSDCGDYKNKTRSERIQHALAAAETLTGLIVASAVVQPDKKLASVKLKSLKKKFKNKAFAANCKRELILECEKIGLSLEEFLEIGLKALQGISNELNL